MLKSIDPRWRRMVAIDHRRGHHRLFFSLEGHVAGCCRANSFAIILIYAPVSSRRRHAVGRLGLHVPAPEISSLRALSTARCTRLSYQLFPLVSMDFDPSLLLDSANELRWNTQEARVTAQRSFHAVSYARGTPVFAH